MAFALQMNLVPIGVVRNGVEAGREVKWADLVSRLFIEDSCLPGLLGIDDFSHLVVVYWMHRLEPGARAVLQVHPMRKPELPLTGVFATRSPARPNPLGVTAVRLMGREGNALLVKGLDATDGTPVVDIKPYLPDSDSVPGATVAGWVQRMAR